MEKSDKAALLYKFVERNITDSNQCLALKRKRLAIDPNDRNAASGFANLAIETKNYELLVGDDLPAIVRQENMFLYYQAQAFLALNRKSEALATLAKAEEVLATAEFKNDFTWISELYFKAGQTEKAREVALRYGNPWPLDYAKALARVGDKDAIAACVEKSIDNNSQMPPHIMFGLVDACREVNLPELAQRTFDEAERRTLNLKTIPYEITYRYEKEGLAARLVEKRLPLATNDRAMQTLLNPLIDSYKKEIWPQALEMLALHLSEYEKNWIYQYSYAYLLEMLNRPQEALPYYRKAAALRPVDKLGMVSNPRPDDGIYRCLLAVKDYAGCETFVKENMNGILGIFYENTQQWDKAIEAYQSKNDYQRAFGLILEHRGQEAAARYIKTIPPEHRAALDDFLLEARKDTASLVKAARDRVVASPNDPDLHAKLALRLLQDKQVQEARQEVRKACEMGELFQLFPRFRVSPSDIIEITSNVGLYQIIPLYDDNKILSQLETDLKSLITRSNAYRAGYLRFLAGHYAKTNQIASAIDAYEKAADIDPYSAHMYRETIASLQKKS